jgi:chloramphenicol 3-O phosphotransferase
MSETTTKVIFLNGASSSGKTSIARELQKVLSEPYLHVSVDAFLHQLPAFLLADGARLAQEFPRLLAGFNSSSAAIARAGNSIIVDTVLEEPSWVAPCVMAFEGLDVVFVAVRCSLEVLERREKARGDRRAGLARYQYGRVHSICVYDLEVDSSIMPLDACVSRILEYLRSGEKPSAFRKLRAASESREQSLAADG